MIWQLIPFHAFSSYRCEWSHGMGWKITDILLLLIKILRWWITSYNFETELMMNSIKIQGNGRFCAEKTALKRTMKFTRFIVYLLLKVIKQCKFLCNISGTPWSKLSSSRLTLLSSTLTRPISSLKNVTLSWTKSSLKNCILKNLKIKSYQDI